MLGRKGADQKKKSMLSLTTLNYFFSANEPAEKMNELEPIFPDEGSEELDEPEIEEPVEESDFTGPDDDPNR